MGRWLNRFLVLYSVIDSECVNVLYSNFVIMYELNVGSVVVVVFSGKRGLGFSISIWRKFVMVYVIVMGSMLCGCYLNSSSFIVRSSVVMGVLNMVVMFVVVLVISSVLCLVVVSLKNCVNSELIVLFVMMIGLFVLNGLLLLIIMFDDSGLSIVILGDILFLLNRMVLMVLGMLWL